MIESFNELSEHFDTYILSTSPWENHTAPSDKLKWVKNDTGFDSKIKQIISVAHRLIVFDFTTLDP